MHSASSGATGEYALNTGRSQPSDTAPWRSDRTARRHDTTATVNRALGWFSVGLGLTQLLAPRRMARLTGMEDGATLMRALGMRELANGAGILIRDKPGWVWARVAGDAMDLALLGMAVPASRQRNRLAWTAAAVAGVAALDVMASVRQKRRPLAARKNASGAIAVDKALIVNRDPQTCYHFWRDLTNLPRFMQHVDAIELRSETLSHWVARGPAGTHVEWDAEITAEEPGHLLAWRSTENAEVANAGAVRFEPGPGGHGTLLRVELHYMPPAGKAGVLVARLFGEEPSQQIDEDLRRFKQLLETGELPTTVGQSAGPRSVVGRLLHRGDEGAPR